MNFGICHMSPDLPTGAVAVITDLDYLDWLCDISHFVNFCICHMRINSPTEADAVITDIWITMICYEMQPIL